MKFVSGRWRLLSAAPLSFKSQPRIAKSARFTWTLIAIVTVVLTASAWVALKAQTIHDELQKSRLLMSDTRQAILENDPIVAAQKVGELQSRTKAALHASEDPVWRIASVIPWFGHNLAAVSEIARSADDVATLGLRPVVDVFGNLNWTAVMPGAVEADLTPIERAAPNLASAAHAVEASAARLEEIGTEGLIAQVADPLMESRNQLRAAGIALRGAADAAAIVPAMMGSGEPRRYLLLIQNNAEVRASGGIPTALAVLDVRNGRMALSGQTTANTLGRMEVPVAIPTEQEVIYSERMGRFMQDVNLTPDFPTAAATAAEMWRVKTGEIADGVISVDPVALSYVLEGIGPVSLDNENLSLPSALPSYLDAGNVAKVLMSDVYAAIPNPAEQDLYFAEVAKEVFSKLEKGAGDRNAILKGIERGVESHRVHAWSAHSDEQRVLQRYPVGGSVVRDGMPAAQFGIYFNDGTGAKMDYYVSRTVQLIKECPRDGYEQTTIRVTSTNKAPSDAATSLPAYVTGGGVFGVPPGSVETNVVAYGPVQAHVETAKLDGQHIGFAPYLHSNRPVGVVAVRLAPGESHTVDFTFGKIVQHAEPNVVVTPGVQDVKDVVLPTEGAQCG